ICGDGRPGSAFPARDRGRRHELDRRPRGRVADCGRAHEHDAVGAGAGRGRLVGGRHRRAGCGRGGLAGTPGPPSCASHRGGPPAATTTLPDVTTNNPAETEEIGRRLGERLRPGDVVLLTGELGAGKTTLVRGVAQGIGSKAPVASPTFQLVRVYPGRVQLAHV